MNSAQQNHAATKKESLSILATLKEFRNIPSGQQITVFIDHKNLTHANFNTECVMRWRLVLEDSAQTSNASKACFLPSVQQKTTDWHHETLCHPGNTRTKAAVRQHFDWKGLRTMVVATCKTCLHCQLAKPTNQKHGNLPAKAAKENPWDTL
jgi:hypothetical protein